MQTRHTPRTEEPAKKKIASGDNNGETKKPSSTLAEEMVAEAKRRAAAMLLAKRNAPPKVFNPIEAAKARAAEINKTFIQRKQMALYNTGSMLVNQYNTQKQNQPPSVTAALTQASTPTSSQTPQTAVSTTTQNQVSRSALLPVHYLPRIFLQSLGYNFRLCLYRYTFGQVTPLSCCNSS